MSEDSQLVVILQINEKQAIADAVNTSYTQIACVSRTQLTAEPEFDNTVQ